ncbi:hypothetical protein ADUPG1_011080 [Aduncisulcus paluster]|uniref:Uncharacterized protein n=1 Tax=Aduncisulcus paluster TaxID=2918883 RepID=A0ABQ5JU54_9EUKA|nr:hypothetical protein ADUPG1_011080 [Aduncisulcus paluster]
MIDDVIGERGVISVIDDYRNPDHGTMQLFFEVFHALCQYPSIPHTLELYSYLKDNVIEPWYDIISKTNNESLMRVWAQLISVFASVTSFIPKLSPIYDDRMARCRMVEDIMTDKDCRNLILFRYLLKVSYYISTSCFLKLFRSSSIAIINMVPSIELSHGRDSDMCTVNCFGMEIVCTLNSKEYLFFHNGISRKYMDWKCIKRGPICGSSLNTEDGDESSSSSCRIQHSSLIQYTPPQRLVVSMPIKGALILIQNFYDFIERTGCGVELLFEDKITHYSYRTIHEELEEERHLREDFDFHPDSDMGYSIVSERYDYSISRITIQKQYF